MGPVCFAVDFRLLRCWTFETTGTHETELYDLEADPGERANLAGQERVRDVESQTMDRPLSWLSTASETDPIAPRWTLPAAGKQKD